LIKKLSRVMPAELTMTVGGLENCSKTCLNAVSTLFRSVTWTPNAVCPAPTIKY